MRASINVGSPLITNHNRLRRHPQPPHHKLLRWRHGFLRPAGTTAAEAAASHSMTTGAPLHPGTRPSRLSGLGHHRPSSVCGFHRSHYRRDKQALSWWLPFYDPRLALRVGHFGAVAVDGGFFGIDDELAPQGLFAVVRTLI
jgi:hypothetical protein